MFRSIQAECFKVVHRPYFWITTILCALFSVGVIFCLYLIKTEAGGVNPLNMPFAVTALLFGLPAGIYLVVLGVDMVFSEQYKYNTLKNEVSFGISRLRIYISRWLVTLLVLGMLYLVLIGVCDADTQAEADRLVRKMLNLRIFSDENGKTNLSLGDVGGELLVVSQFTLYADCRKGNRPSFIKAGEPEKANRLYEYFMDCCRQHVSVVERGRFGADMKVELVNDGPFTLMLDSQELFGKQ